MHIIRFNIRERKERIKPSFNYRDTLLFNITRAQTHDEKKNNNNERTSVMRLQFLGDQPPHPAFLDDVARTLSLKLTCVRAMLLTKECVRVLLLGEENADDDDAKTALKSSRIPLKDLTDETTSRETIEICADAIETILRGSVRYELSADELRRELERLGLPKVLFLYL